MNGDLFARDPEVEFVIPPVGNFNNTLRLFVSSKSLTTEVATSGLTTEESAALLFIQKLLRNKMTTDPNTGLITIYDDDDTSVLVQGDLFEDVAGSQPYRGRGAERRDRLV